MEQTDATRIFEDDYSSTKLDALYAHSGWSPFATLPDRPWAGLDTSSHIGDSGRWVTRRMLVSMWSTDFEVDNLSVADAFVSAVEGALAYHNDVSRMCALEEVFASWGDVIPMAAIVGCTITATGLLLPDTNLEPVSSVSEPVNPATFRDLNGFIDTQLQIQGKFERTLKYHVTGGRPDILLRQGFDAWLDNIKTTQGWDIIKVTKVIPITDILDHAIQQRIKQLYANRNVFFRSPSIGGSSQFGFEGDGNGLYLVRRIEIGFSNECIESLSIRYADGAIAGPYGLSGNTTRLDTLVLAQGEFVTDIFIWPTDHFIASLQLVKNTGYVSPIYGATRGITQPLRLLNGNGKALAGLSGGYDNVGITQLQVGHKFTSQIGRRLRVLCRLYGVAISNLSTTNARQPHLLEARTETFGMTSVVLEIGPPHEYRESPQEVQVLVISVTFKQHIPRSLMDTQRIKNPQFMERKMGQ
ncbi:unnamed protein product [Rhizoctonia solani]|uniref:Jacalin-type lectin domain-containing protein n=1 Tax=Rhizoctonia solani TaxID=456999 RepID=A0A8H3H3U4_9AGAM|nr:unnamed protein product [Rhizoctonia solani]